MIQVRSNIFETNSSSTHCLTVMPREMYDNWRAKQIAVSIQYVYSPEEKDINFGNDPEIRLPLNFITLQQAENMSKEKYGDDTHYYEFCNLVNGDNEFMGTWGNFDTYAPIIRTVEIGRQVEENLKLLNDYIRLGSLYIDIDDWKESGEYERFIELVKEYESTGKFTEEMYEEFPNHLYFTADEYYEMLKSDECDSPFIHAFNDYVAFGHYFHS